MLSAPKAALAVLVVVRVEISAELGRWNMLAELAGLQIPLLTPAAAAVALPVLAELARLAEMAAQLLRLMVAAAAAVRAAVLPLPEQMAPLLAAMVEQGLQELQGALAGMVLPVLQEVMGVAEVETMAEPLAEPAEPDKNGMRPTAREAEAEAVAMVLLIPAAMVDYMVVAEVEAKAVLELARMA